ncbi:Extracellular exo-alpha-L-arabinofuranosidase [Pedobacter sp. Bi27]|uniref:alpha-L-arabinofuranosidase C-terminal domain-containing protein n=1 Tax=unclassified Pedobacter TaxID=2628915 RepID=UPI001D60F63C|nr:MULTISPECIES: alpha-L-arabinofuranosidase C-terminal domain-containing protein [unclassified Pedobacter]CAH0260073.1 Extracellular exo-alpha-L-arabinofuranosidase [Pedobacter sp. Bi36]CAH0286976.1 Extracellular exo-alpha-L-arabinofuranosidase [Pedobacter sp. Bi126]CAH0290412.1 Extracellular exo-alpha-L-arabinofuranosidase [Pedobacter sp. Bi27]
MKLNYPVKSVFSACLVYVTIGIGYISEVQAQTAKVIKVKTDHYIAKVQPNMWGVFFEDINFGADGGIYAELIKNRSFEFAKPLMGWTISRRNPREGEVLVVNRKEVNSTNPRYLQVKKQTDDFELINEGFKGIGVKKGMRYDFSVMYRQAKPGVRLTLLLKAADNKVIGQGRLTPDQTGGDWKKQSASFTATETDPKARFSIVFQGNGNIDLDMISLFPGDTWKNRPQGLRADMVQLLADMKPGFIRFPGGCIVEGTDLANRYQWKKTIGPIENRQLIMNRWNTEFAHRPAPDYYQSFGLGFFEYFQLAEDIGSDALPILNCGMACQFNSAEVASLDELDPYVQDALDLIEFANGDVTTKWGKMRADLGHPKPFNLKMMGVGNENWGPQYLERLEIFTKAIKAKYPDFKLIYSSGTGPDGDRFNLLNTTLRSNNADFIDEHYYRPADWFLKNAGRYDNYPRNGSKVFVGEYAVHADNSIVGSNRNNWQSALASASLMTGLERNADVVQMASYAPLFAHIDAWQWAPDMIWVDNLKSYGTPDYYVQKQFSTNKGTDVVSITLDEKNIIGQDGLYASAVTDQTKKELIIKIANNSGQAQNIDFDLEGKMKLKNKATNEEIASSNLNQFNSFENPEAVSPQKSAINLKGKKLNITLKPYSFNVIKIPFNQ